MAEDALFVPSFKAEYGYKNKYCAFDMVHACETLLEAPVSLMHASETLLEASISLVYWC